MLNMNQERELCYVTQIDAIEPIAGSDNCEAAVVGGWRIMTRKNTFKPRDLAIYFEIDSRVPEKEPFLFLSSKGFKVKIQKYTFGGKGNFISQGLLMSAEDFGWKRLGDCIEDSDKNLHFPNSETRFLTKQLGVTYADPEDNKRKGISDKPANKYSRMIQRYPKFFKKPLIKKLMKYSFFREFFYFIIGKKAKKVAGAKAFPSHLPYIHKSDEERVENLPFILEDKDPWVKTVKIDGTSSLYLLERKPRNKFEYWVCSRNVRQLDRNQTCYHEDNVYWEVEDKYHIRDFLEKVLKEHPNWSYAALQGESAGITSSGAKIQGDPHNFKELRFFGYNFIESETGRWETEKAANLVERENGIPWVPIVDTNYILPDDFEEFKLSADGVCEAEGASGLREGYVYRRKEFNSSKVNSFKNVSRQYLLKH